MSVKEMDVVQTSSCESDPKQVLISKECEPASFRNNSHSVRILEDLQSLRKDEVLCDIRLETDDGCATFGHKNVLMAASPYFRATFKSRKICKTGNNTFNIRKLDSTILQLLVDYIYTGEIKVTKENVQMLLAASNLLQLDFVNGACTEFLQKQLNASNCLDIRAFARLHNCTELLSSSEKLIKKQYLEVIKSDEFLSSVSVEDVMKIISCNDLAVPYEEKVILMFNRSDTSWRNCYTEWYDPVTKLRAKAPGLNECRMFAGLGVIRDQFVFAVGGVNLVSSKSVSMLDVSSQSPSWVPMADMVVERRRLGVGVLDDCIYAVGGRDDKNSLNSVEVFEVSIQKWRLVASMCTKRCDFGVGVLNNRLYAVGGGSNGKVFKSVEYYDPSLDTWTQVAELSIPRKGVGVAVLDGLMYAIGGYTYRKYLRSVEVYRPSDGIWSSVADMKICRLSPGVVALGGLLYVMGGRSGDKSTGDTVEIYNPKTNTWTMERFSRSGEHIFGGVVVDRPHFIN